MEALKVSDRDVAVKTLVAAYKDVLRRLREARAEAQGITDKIFEQFLEWMEERMRKTHGGRPRYIFWELDEFYEEMGIKDRNVRTGLSIRLQHRYLRWREST